MSAVAAAKIFGWNFKDEVRRPNGLRSKKPPKKFLQNELAAQAVSAKKRPQEKAFMKDYNALKLASMASHVASMLFLLCFVLIKQVSN